ncbi:hypothetical protein [Marinobacter litoralis]|uniref:hypothetical protein n=1 Tax=Marinobacter litoralis TaxID=187981 RepID=UPI0018ED249D|nr:hypothetical protein [Marinobacter litoralis]MBJ6136102.1 hypothetical protein [Marinobacter litoralis]
MRTQHQIHTFEKWLSELESLAENEGCPWMISSDPEYHRKAFEDGVSPAEEFERLKKISAGSGCGCGS